MLNLIKYELLKTKKAMTFAVIAYLLVSLYTIIMYAQGQSAKGLVVYVLFGNFMVVFLLISNMKVFISDLRKKTGYMLFLTPNTSYKILGSKIITVLLENFIFAVCYTVILLIGVIFVSQSTSEFMTVIRAMMSSTIDINIQLTLRDYLAVFAIVSSIILYYVNVLLTINLSIVIYKSFFNHLPYGFLISLLGYVIIRVVIGKICDLFVLLFGGSKMVLVINSLNTLFNGGEINFGSGYLFIGFAVYCLISAILFIGAGYLMEKKMNV